MEENTQILLEIPEACLTFRDEFSVPLEVCPVELGNVS
jgi:hypothetical protein